MAAYGQCQMPGNWVNQPVTETNVMHDLKVTENFLQPDKTRESVQQMVSVLLENHRLVPQLNTCSHVAHKQ